MKNQEQLIAQLLAKLQAKFKGVVPTTEQLHNAIDTGVVELGIEDQIHLNSGLIEHRPDIGFVFLEQALGRFDIAKIIEMKCHLLAGEADAVFERGYLFHDNAVLRGDRPLNL